VNPDSRAAKLIEHARGHVRLWLAGALILAILIGTGIVGLITVARNLGGGQTAAPIEPVAVSTAGPALPGDTSSASEPPASGWLSDTGLVLPPRTDDPRKFAMYAALAVTTWNTRQVTRDELVESFYGFAQPTPEYAGVAWPSQDPGFRGRLFYVGQADEAIPTEDALTTLASVGGYSTAEAREVLIDDQLVAFRTWKPDDNTVTGPGTGTHLVTVRLSVIVAR